MDSASAAGAVPHNMAAILAFTQSLPHRELPASALEGARFCIVDWFGTAIGAQGQPAAEGVRRMVESWNASGRSPVLLGKPTTPAGAALVNATMAHALDFDDNHVGSMAHLSGPVWASAFAVGTEVGATPMDMIKAFVGGFEVGGRLGTGGFGVALNAHHFHSTGVLGCIGAGVAAAMLYRLDAAGMQRTLGLAATQVGGLLASFGTDAKPFHAGKAAMNGVMAAQLARQGVDASTTVLEPSGGLERALVQDGSSPIRHISFEDGWELNRNTFKPYAACLMTHPTIDAAIQLQSRGVRPGDIEKLVVRAHPFAIQMAGKPAPSSPLEGKFSLAYCASISLHGHAATHTGFSDRLIADPSVRRVIESVTLVPDESKPLTASDVEVLMRDGQRHVARTALALGNPGNPMTWTHMDRKFMSLVEPVAGARAADLLQAIKRLDREPAMDVLLALLGS